MGSSRRLNCTRGSTAPTIEAPPPVTDPDLLAIAAAFNDAIAVIETATIAIEASEEHGGIAQTLRVGIRALLDAYALLDLAVDDAQGVRNE